MGELILRAYLAGKAQAARVFTEERGDQNVGALGLIVVTLLIVGILVKVFVPGVEEILQDVMKSMKDKLKVGP